MTRTVIVQQMAEASAAGILFTCNPVTGARDEMVLNASWGLGEAIVSGQVNPDTITLEKQNGQVKCLNVAEKMLMPVPTTGGVAIQEVPANLRQRPVLSLQQIARLFELGTAVDQHFSAPQDIEWAIAGEQVFLLQARPVTTRSDRQTVTVRQEELPVPGGDAWEQREKPEVHSYDLWTRTNIGENFLDPITPQSATLWLSFFVLGRLPSKEERPPGAPPLPTLGERFYGRMYVNEGAVIHGALEMGVPTSFLDSTWGSSGRGMRSSDDTIHVFRLSSHVSSIIGRVRKAAREQAKQRPETPKRPKQKQPRRSPEQLFAQIDAWFNWLLKQAQDKTRLRDNNRSYVAKFLFPMRLLLVELGRRWTTRGWLVDPDDIFFLTLYEINDIISTENPLTLGTDLIKTTAARRTTFDYWHTINAPAALGPGGLPLADPQLTGSYLQGLPASAGQIRGTARLVGSISEAAQLAPGEILVTQGTDPGWTPFFPLVSGLVLETGGLLSHGAIIAREYGVPAVINVPGALGIIKNGSMIDVDGASGRVYLEMSRSKTEREDMDPN